MKRRTTIATILFVGCLLWGATFSFAQQSIRVVNDAEFSQYMSHMAEPLAKTLGLDTEQLRFHLVLDDSVNAFVASQRDVFFHSGLIEKARNANEVRGVLAHELGHIHGRHLTRMASQAQKLTIPTLLAGVLGIGAAAAGNPMAASAVLAGGMAAGQSVMLQFSRSHEQQADQIAVNVLTKNNYDPEGLRDFFNRLKTSDLLFHDAPPPYLLTHPRPQERQSFLDNVVKNNQVKSETPDETASFERIKAKVYAMANSPSRTLRHYYHKESPAITYARVWAYGLQGDLAKSEKLLEELKKEWPNDVFLTELDGLIQVDKGELAKAVELFKTAHEQLPSSPKLHYQYALSLYQADLLDDALNEFLQLETQSLEWPNIYRQLGLIYGKQSKLALSHLSFAEEAMLKKNWSDAEFHIATAEHYNKNNSQIAARIAALKMQLADKK